MSDQFACFFFSDGTAMRVMCCECWQGLTEKFGWQYTGPLGPWVYRCHLCHRVIHKPEKETDAATAV